ncbi:MAG: 50S ribosomal protein L13 [Candidatus Omnitrophota bacterium]
MNKTYIAKKEEIKRKWYLIDAKDKILGRVAVRAAVILRGKHKAIFAPHMDAGDGVIVINAAKIRVSGRKMQQKIYRRYSGYPGGLREVNLQTMLEKNPANVVRLAVKRMLPQGPLGRDIFKKLKVYSNDKHSHQSQNPSILEV